MGRGAPSCPERCLRRAATGGPCGELVGEIFKGYTRTHLYPWRNRAERPYVLATHIADRDDFDLEAGLDYVAELGEGGRDFPEAYRHGFGVSIDFNLDPKREAATLTKHLKYFARQLDSGKQLRLRPRGSELLVYAVDFLRGPGGWRSGGDELFRLGLARVIEQTGFSPMVYARMGKDS